MKYTQYALIKNGLLAFPVMTTLGSAVVTYLWSTSGTGFQIMEGTLQRTAIDVLIGTSMGLCGGLVISLFGQVALHHVHVEDDPIKRAKRRADDGTVIMSKASIVYKKEDVKDNEKSVTKTMNKYREQAEAEQAEKSQILEMGTEGIERKKREQLGLSSSNKNAVANKSGGNKSGVKNNATPKK